VCQLKEKKLEKLNGFTNIFSRMAIGFDRQEKRFELNFVLRKTFLQIANQVATKESSQTDSQFAQSPPFNETP